ncbi:unnamed protein product [Prunus brigantina]
MSTIIRRRKNKIDRLKNDAGVWVDEAEDIKYLAMNYFIDLFSPAHVPTSRSATPNLFPCIDPGQLASLVTTVDLEEIKVSLFSIGGIKAPGRDGFPACFYRS